MNHIHWTQFIEGGVVLLAGIILAAAFANDSRPNNLVGIYYLEARIPKKDAFDTTYSAFKDLTPANIVAKTKDLLDPDCRAPNPNPFPDTSPYKSPVCTCLYKVLDASLAQNRFDLTSKAFTACFHTQQHIPALKPLFGSNPSISDPQSRKSISRSGIIFILCGALLFHMIYSSLSEYTWSTPMGVAKQLALLLCMLFNWFAPLFSGVNNGSLTGNIASMQSIIFLAPILEGFLIEFFLAYVYTHRRRVAYIHPYVFLVTFLALIQMAMIENGVFDWHVLFSHFWTAQSLTFAYAAVLFFMHFGCGRWKQEGHLWKLSHQTNSFKDMDRHTTNGLFIIIATVTLITLTNSIPNYPVASNGLTFTWILPWAFVLLAFGIPVYIEHMLDAPDPKQATAAAPPPQEEKGDAPLTEPEPTEDAKEETLVWLSHLGYILYLAIVAAAIIYYLALYWRLGFGTRIMSKRGGVGAFINFGLPTRPNNPNMYITM